LADALARLAEDQGCCTDICVRSQSDDERWSIISTGAAAGGAS